LVIIMSTIDILNMPQYHVRFISNYELLWACIIRFWRNKTPYLHITCMDWSVVSEPLTCNLLPEFDFVRMSIHNNVTKKTLHHISVPLGNKIALHATCRYKSICRQCRLGSSWTGQELAVSVRQDPRSQSCSFWIFDGLA
jgi:hypothetical protein